MDTTQSVVSSAFLMINDRNSNPYKGTPIHVMNPPPESILTEVQNAIFSSDCSPELGSPWENGYVESFNGRLRDELLAREQFDTLLEAKVLIERWRRHYNTVRPHGSLGYRPPAPEVMQRAT